MGMSYVINGMMTNEDGKSTKWWQRGGEWWQRGGEAALHMFLLTRASSRQQVFLCMHLQASPLGKHCNDIPAEWIWVNEALSNGGRIDESWAATQSTLHPIVRFLDYGDFRNAGQTLAIDTEMWPNLADLYGMPVGSLVKYEVPTHYHSRIHKQWDRRQHFISDIPFWMQ